MALTVLVVLVWLVRGFGVVGSILALIRFLRSCARWFVVGRPRIQPARGNRSCQVNPPIALFGTFLSVNLFESFPSLWKLLSLPSFFKCVLQFDIRSLLFSCLAILTSTLKYPANILNLDQRCNVD
jgi:hypothetical protein